MLIKRRGFIFTLDATFAAYLAMISLAAVIIFFQNVSQVDNSYFYLFSFFGDASNFAYYFDKSYLPNFLDKYGLAYGSICDTKRVYIVGNTLYYEYGLFDNGDPNIWFQSKIGNKYANPVLSGEKVCFKDY